MEGMAVANRNKMALMYGALLGMIHVVVSTGTNMTVDNALVLNLSKAVAYLMYMVILGFLAIRIRKANGGYIEFREVFGAVFVMLLVAGLITYVYTYLYTTIIVPDFTERYKNASIRMLESRNMTDDEMESSVKALEAQLAPVKDNVVARQLLNFLSTIVLDCLFGLIVCAIVKKPKPLFD